MITPWSTDHFPKSHLIPFEEVLLEARSSRYLYNINKQYPASRNTQTKRKMQNKFDQTNPTSWFNSLHTLTRHTYFFLTAKKFNRLFLFDFKIISAFKTITVRSTKKKPPREKDFWIEIGVIRNSNRHYDELYCV